MNFYDQYVISVPEKHVKRLAKAIKKKFGVHVIEGGTCHSTEGITVNIFANHANEELIKVIQIWAEGFVEGTDV